MNLNPLSPKYDSLYMGIAVEAAKQSTAKKLKVGAAVVTPKGMVGVGWNGMPAGMPNQCEATPCNAYGPIEGEKLITHPEVIHAERNALDKFTREGISSLGSTLFVTHAPCMECAKSVFTVGIKRVVYIYKYRCSSGIEFLSSQGVEVEQYPHSSRW